MAMVRPERVSEALFNLSNWREKVRSQSAPHLLPLLALLEAGAGSFIATPFREQPDEYSFWNRYLRLDADEHQPYFNPIGLKRAEANFPHSNAATIRKNTFANRWKAAEVTSDSKLGDVWTLSPRFAEIFSQKVLKKGDNTTRAPVVDLAAILFRGESFAQDATPEDLERRFRERFTLRDADYHQIFAFRQELPEHMFGADYSPADYAAAIDGALLAFEPVADQPSARSGVEEAVDQEDPLLLQVQQLLRLGTSGIILRGAPGTGKSYYAGKLADWLVSDPTKDVFPVQFHPSFGYEDFVEGYAPDEGNKAGFSVVEKLFMDACRRARAVAPKHVVVIIDEINRGDPARVFGELLTYLERSYRDREFRLPFSGKPFSIPPNLLLLGTMNPFDRSVSHLDAAFIRRFDHIDVRPSRDVVETFLITSRGFSEEQITLIGDWFDAAQRIIVPMGLGHSFFEPVKDIESLKLVWRYRIRPTAEALLELDTGRREGLESSFEKLIERLDQHVAAN